MWTRWHQLRPQAMQAAMAPPAGAGYKGMASIQEHRSRTPATLRPCHNCRPEVTPKGVRNRAPIERGIHHQVFGNTSRRSARSGRYPDGEWFLVLRKKRRAVTATGKRNSANQAKSVNVDSFRILEPEVCKPRKIAMVTMPKKQAIPTPHKSFLDVPTCDAT